ALDEYVGNETFSPATRFRLGRVAERLRAEARDFPRTLRNDAYRLAARFYQAAGQIEKALDAARMAVWCPGDRSQSQALLAEVLYERADRRGPPPVDAYIREELAKHRPFPRVLLRLASLAVAIVRDGKVLL